MVQSSEIISLLLSAAVVAFLCIQWRRLQRVPRLFLLVAAFGVECAAGVFTVLEGFFWFPLFNFLEHGCYALAACLVAAWCYAVCSLAPKEARDGWRP